ncbi:unnamed protein product [Ambrosiozyma monospora]|uniref:Unnamed protein product n=1 Tax=Ambrosiozyma monospora TaxID=43982 RepID=A0ACB5U8W9_AMBMO|nr:unnamed protein product [Ambrosiozyma monospora]
MLSCAFLISKRRLIPTLVQSSVSRSSVLFFNDTVKTTDASNRFSEFSGEIDESSIHPDKPRKLHRLQRLELITNYQDAIGMGLVPENILYALVDDPTVDLTTIHEAISKYFTSAVPEHKRGALGHSCFPNWL